MPEKDLFETEWKLGMKVGCWQCSGKLCQNEGLPAPVFHQKRWIWGPETNPILRADTHIMLRKFEGDTKRVGRLYCIILSLSYFILLYFPLKRRIEHFLCRKGTHCLRIDLTLGIDMTMNRYDHQLEVYISNRSTIWPRYTRICQVYGSYLWIVLLCIFSAKCPLKYTFRHFRVDGCQYPVHLIIYRIRIVQKTLYIYIPYIQFVLYNQSL